MSVLSFVTTLANMSNQAAWPFPIQADQGFSPISAKDMGINFVHCMGDGGKGGVTIAYRKTSDTRNARMVEVAVAYCSPADTFTKKVGKNSALENFLMGMTILVPARTNKSDDSIPINLRNMFWYSI